VDSKQLKDQELRTRALYLEWAITQFQNTGNKDVLDRATSNDWTKNIGEVMSDPFATIKLLAQQREKVQHEWNQEIRALHAAGFSLRSIADVAGVSHDTIWKRVK
jgi:ribosomal protein S11